MDVIFTHDNADFDAVASLLAAWKLYPDAIPVLPQKMNRNVAEFITLYQSGLPFVHWCDFRPSKIKRIILVDTQRVPDLRHTPSQTPVLIIDHHTQKTAFPPHVTFCIEPVGAAVTLLIEQIRARQISLTPLEATLMALGIYVDTGSMTYTPTTPRDILAAAWLLEQNAALDTIRRYLTPPLDDLQQALMEKLIAATEELPISGHTIVVCVAEMPEYVNQINSVAHSLRDMLDPDAIFLLVQMPNALQMVCRSGSDAVDVGEVARHFGGGGHSRASAANIRSRTLPEVLPELRALLAQVIRPMTRVADLMSYGVQTVHVDTHIGEIIPQLRRIGHEGYPVVDDTGTIVGLLTLRDADRALEHGLKRSAVRTVMTGGTVTLRPQDPVSTLEQLMVQSGWGQIPVVGDDGTVLGIVTRTDLIKHWVKTHPAVPEADHRIEYAHIGEILGENVAGLIRAVASYAHQQQTSLYMVGGVVRDLLLNRPNLDIDFVVEANAIQFAEGLCRELGGTLKSYRPFGTAKWRLEDTVSDRLGLDLSALPEHIDFATSRNEFYNHPTALPSVYSSSIKLDLHRRDFTINTLAVQLSPEHAANRLLDFYGGLHDLRNGLIRVLHSLSFVDDPTRVLRAVRFEHRLGFVIEPRTAELIEDSRPMLCRTTGERLRNEIKLILAESSPERALLMLHQRGILQAIHPNLAFDERAAQGFIHARETQDDWPVSPPRMRHLYWHILMAYLPLDPLPEVCNRLLFGKGWMESLLETARLFQQGVALADPDAPVSRIVRELDTVGETTLLAVWVIGSDLQRDRVARYVADWRHVHPVTNGHTLQAHGLMPGPCFRVILNHLRDARLDGAIATDAEEAQALEAILHTLAPENCDSAPL